MKNNKIMPGMLALFLSLAVTAMQAQSFKLEITNIRENDGKVIVALYNSEKDWFEKPFREITFETKEDSKVVAFEVPYGVYAVSVYQDTKGNNGLDRNFLGIPKEPIAFGNNYKPFGDPDYRSASITFDANYKIQTLKLYKVF